MRTLAPTAALFIAFFACTSCQRSANEPSQSLVGASNLPSSAVLSRELIEIDHRFGDPGPVLILELAADDSLTVTVTDWDRKQIRRFIVGRQLIHLSKDTARRARRLLWRLRPETLDGIGTITRPVGCPPSEVDETPDYSVGFFAGGFKPHIEDEQAGVFALYRSCTTRNAKLARAVLQNVLAILPRSPLVAEYDRRVLVLRRDLGMS